MALGNGYLCDTFCMCPIVEQGSPTPTGWSFQTGFLLGVITVVMVQVALLYQVAHHYLLKPKSSTPSIPDRDKVPVFESNDTDHLLNKSAFRLCVKCFEFIQSPDIPIKQDYPQVPHSHTESWPPSIIHYLEQELKTDADIQKERMNHFVDSAMDIHSDTIASNYSSSSTRHWDAGGTCHTRLATTPTESCLWLNMVLHRFFLESRIQLNDIQLGDHPPILNGMRIVKGLTQDLAVVCEADLQYKGGAHLTVQVEWTGGYQLPFKIQLNGLEGKIRIRIPSPKYPDMMAIAFVQDPGAHFTVTPLALLEGPIEPGFMGLKKTLFNMTQVFFGASTTTSSSSDDSISSSKSKATSVVSDLVGSVLNRLVCRVFLDQWVLPNYRTFYLPLMNPMDALALVKMQLLSGTWEQRDE